MFDFLGIYMVSGSHLQYICMPLGWDKPVCLLEREIETLFLYRVCLSVSLPLSVQICSPSIFHHHHHHEGDKEMMLALFDGMNVRRGGRNVVI